MYTDRGSSKTKLSVSYRKITILFAYQWVQNFLCKMDSWKFFLTTPENGHMSPDASVILFAAVLSVQHPLPLPSTCSPLFPLQNMLSADIFSLKKNGPFCGLSFKLFLSHFFWSWITVLSSNSIIYLSFFSFLPVEVSKQSEFQRNEKP